MYIYKNINIHKYVHILFYICIHICIHTYIYIYICIYIHNIHTYIHHLRIVELPHVSLGLILEAHLSKFLKSQLATRLTMSNSYIADF